jgi:hypothetical protein
VLTEIFTDQAHEVASIDLALDQGSGQNYLSEDEELQIKEKLRGWGYL